MSFLGDWRQYLVSRQPAPRVLVIDPEPVVRASLGQALDAEGYQVDAVGSIDDAVLLLGRHRFQVAVMDVASATGAPDPVARLRRSRPALKVVDLSSESCTTTGVVDAVALLLQ